jgi:glutathione S-transferase
MKLFYSPGACSLAPHIVAQEAGIPLTLERVDLAAKSTEAQADFLAINPKGYVPALQLDDGTVLTEGVVVMQYLADQKPEAGLVPPNGTLPRYRLQEWLTYINSELHKSYSPLFNPATPEQTRAERGEYLLRRYRLVEAHLATHPYLMGELFSIADAYLFVVTNWARIVKLDLGGLPALLAFQQRVAARPAVQAALKAEGLVK